MPFGVSAGLRGPVGSRATRIRLRRRDVLRDGTAVVVGLASPAPSPSHRPRLRAVSGGVAGRFRRPVPATRIDLSVISVGCFHRPEAGVVEAGTGLGLRWHGRRPGRAQCLLRAVGLRARTGRRFAEALRADAAGIREGPLRRPGSAGRIAVAGVAVQPATPCAGQPAAATAPQGANAMRTARISVRSAAGRRDRRNCVKMRRTARGRVSPETPDPASSRPALLLPGCMPDRREGGGHCQRTGSFAAPEGVGPVPAHLAPTLGSTRVWNVVRRLSY